MEIVGMDVKMMDCVAEQEWVRSRNRRTRKWADERNDGRAGKDKKNHRTKWNYLHAYRWDSRHLWVWDLYLSISKKIKKNREKKEYWVIKYNFYPEISLVKLQISDS